MDDPSFNHRGGTPAQIGRDQPGERAQDSKKNARKPWRKMMWCIGRVTAEYRRRMYDLPALYAKPYDSMEPVVCVDEKSKQLLRQTRSPIAAKPGQIAKEDCEYKRAGTRNLFVAVEPKGGHREVQVSARRARAGFRGFCPPSGQQGIQASAQNSSGHGQSQHPLSVLI